MADEIEPGNTETDIDKPKRKKQRKSVRYSKRVHAAIVEQLQLGMSVGQIEQMPGMPSKMSYYKWRAKNKAFRDDCHQAKIEGCFALIDEAKDIVDDGTNDWMDVEQADGSTKRVVDREVVARSKLRVDFRMTLASKLLPKIFGDKIEVEHKADESIAALIKAGRERAYQNRNNE